MKRKVMAVAILLSLLLAVQAAAYSGAVGAEFSLKVGNGLPSSALLSLRLPRFPPVLGLGVSIPASGPSSFTLLADWWLAQGPLIGFVNYYVGPGLFVGISDSTQLGFRVPIGFDAYPIKPLELFVEFAPAVTILSSGGLGFSQVGLQTGFGFRFWF